MRSAFYSLQDPLVDHPRGLVLTLCLFVTLRLGEIALNSMSGIGLSLTTVREVAISNTLDILLFCLLLLVLKEVGHIDLKKLLLERLPRIGESLKFGLLGFVLSIRGLAQATGLPTYFGHDGYVAFVLLDALNLSLILPLIEETLFRGVCFGSLLAVGRIRAYAISTTIFLIWHIKFIDLIVIGTTGITWSHAASIVLFGLLGAFIYEKTGKLLLCVVFHGAGNALVASTPFFMYLLNY